MEDQNLTQLSSSDGLFVGKGLTVPPKLGYDRVFETSVTKQQIDRSKSFHE